MASPTPVLNSGMIEGKAEPAHEEFSLAQRVLVSIILGSASTPTEAADIKVIQSEGSNFNGTKAVLAALLSAGEDSSSARLWALLDRTGSDEYGELSPTQHAFKTAFELVSAAERLAGVGLLGSPTIDSEGGIRFTWRAGRKEVRLICPATASNSVYVYEQPAEGQPRVFNENITSEFLAQRLISLRERGARTTAR